MPILKYPHAINTINGYSAIVTNPERDHYHFQITTPINYDNFDWYEQTYQHHKGTKKAVYEQVDVVPDEVLRAFWELQRT